MITFSKVSRIIPFEAISVVEKKDTYVFLQGDGRLSTKRRKQMTEVVGRFGCSPIEFSVAGKHQHCFAVPAAHVARFPDFWGELGVALSNAGLIELRAA